MENNEGQQYTTEQLEEMYPYIDLNRLFRALLVPLLLLIVATWIW